MPLSASAQDSEEDGSWLERWHPEAVEDPAKPAPEPASEEPALEMKLDADGVQITPSQPRTVDGYTLEEMKLRVKRAKIGLGASAASVPVGVALGLGGRSRCIASDYWGGTCKTLAIIGGTVLVAGGVAVIVTVVMLGIRNRKLRRLQEAHHASPHRVQWDLAQSRLMF